MVMWNRMWVKLHYLAGRHYDLGCNDPAIEEAVKDQLPAKNYQGTAVTLYDSDYDSDTFDEEAHQLDEDDLMEFWARNQYSQYDVEWYAKRQGCAAPLVRQVGPQEDEEVLFDADDETTSPNADEQVAAEASSV